MSLGRAIRLALAVALLILPLLTRPAAAEAPKLQMTLTGVSVPRIDVASTAHSVEITGTLTNASTVELRAVQVSLARHEAPLTSAAELTAALDSPSLSSLSDAATGGTLAVGSLAPGKSASFTLRATVAELGLRASNAAYVLGAQARGAAVDGQTASAQAVTAIAASATPTPSAALVLLTAAPTRHFDGSFLDDSLAADLTGRLEALLASAERPGVAAAIDPALYDAVAQLSVAHEVAGQSRDPVPGAAEWVARVDALAAAGVLWRLPYGNPDLQVAQATGLLDETLASAETASASLPDLPRVAVLRHSPDEQLAAALTGFHAVVAVGASGAEAGPPQVFGTQPQLWLPGVPSGLQAGRRAALEAVSAQPPLYLITTAEEASLDAALGTAHTLPAVTGREPIAWPADTQAPAWPEVADALEQARANSVSIEEISRTPVDLTRLTAAAFSQGLADEVAAANFVAAASPQPVDPSGVKLVAASSFVMGSRENTFPATLSNSLSIPATVRIEFTSDAPQRLQLDPIEEVTVEAGQSLTLSLAPKATANGVTRVSAQVYTMSGEKIGAPVPIEITATDLGRVGWVIIAVSALVLVGGTAWRIRGERGKRVDRAAQ